MIVMGKFKFTETGIKDMFVVEPTVFEDNRGYFMETFQENDFKQAGHDLTFVQDNQSKSSKGVLRGLHLQVNYPQGKLVRVIKGEVFDVGVDLRSDSKTYGKWIGVELSHENQRQFFLPRGFAHGFLSLEDNSIILYKVDDIHCPDDEGGLIYNDEDGNIDWPFDEIDNITMKEKDKTWKSLKELGDLY